MALARPVIDMATVRPPHRRHQPDNCLEEMLALLERRGIEDRCVLAAMTMVPRELFVPRSQLPNAYADRPLPIGHGQTISQPFIVAEMLQALELAGDERVLEIGTGSGYSTAVLAQLTAHVYSVEQEPALASTARARLAALGYQGFTITCGDGSIGWGEHAPYDAIVVWAGGPSIPQPLIDQLAIGGRLVMPVGRQDVQHLILITKRGEDDVTVRDLGEVLFVPLIGRLGWSDGGGN